jgi:hypothetical protein
MADNLSSLLSDAFTIYSESYSKIGQIGARVADLVGSPAQPKKINQLIESTRLFRVVSPSITLNGAGTAIVGVVGDVATVNNLLLKLKRCVGLYDVPVFPTPLTEFVFNLGSGGSDPDATYITVSAEGLLPNSRRLAAGPGVTLTDNGPQGTMEASANSVLTALQVNYAINPVLNLGGLSERLFYGNGNITGLRTWSLSGASNARRLQAIFTISGLTPGDSTHDQTLWANTTIYTSAGITPSAGVFQPLENREYEIEATTYDGVNWRVNIF